MNFPKLFQGNRLYLKKMDDSDATDQYVGWLNNEKVNRYLATKSTSVSELRKYIASMNEREGVFLFGIFLRDNDFHIGSIKLTMKGVYQRKPDIAIMIGDTASWGKGFGFDAMQLLIDYCFTIMKLESICLGVIRDNHSAIRLYEKMGFQIVEIIVDCVHFSNGTFDQVIMELKNNTLI